LNGEIVVADSSLLALAVDPVGSPLFSGPFDYIYSYCPLDWMVCGELVDFRPLACAQVFQSRKPAFFVWQSRLIQSFDVDSAKAPPDVWLKRLGSSAAAQRWQSSDGQRWWMVWLRTVRPCWCFLRQKLVSHREFHRRFLMLNFCSQMNFIEKAFSPHSLPGLPRLQVLKTNALTG